MDKYSINSSFRVSFMEKNIKLICSSMVCIGLE